MSQPKFSVGEEVILISTLNPHLNGHYTILDRDFVHLTTLQDGSVIKDTYRYKIGVVGSTGSGWWVESSLRKKHKPSEFKDFTSLMDNLKLPQRSVTQ
jgi:hypothetical protein